MATKNPTPKKQPPTRAVGLDAHWAAKRARLLQRSLPEQRLVFCDDDTAKRELVRAETDLAAARVRAEDAYDRRHGPVTGQDRAEFVASAVESEQRATDTARAAVEAASISLHFRALSARRFQELMEAHPPSESEAETGAQFDLNSFPPALVSACHFDRDDFGNEVPGMSVEEAAEFLAAWPTAEANALFSVPFALNQTIRGDLGKG
ncbi:hypothetical protein [Embleya sp. NPDC059237]|uniref:hypothetical protein n=1 Tax=Embleya sp. NPDC059237 TaxID=3346784 RepID=UPI0036C2EF81